MSVNRELFPGETAFAPGGRLDLKVEAERHLHQSRGLRREDLSKTSGAVRVQVGQVQILSIQKVKRLDSQKPRRSLCNLEATRQGKIDGREAGSDKDVAAGRTEREGGGIAKAAVLNQRFAEGFGREDCRPGLDDRNPPAGRYCRCCCCRTAAQA